MRLPRVRPIPRPRPRPDAFFGPLEPPEAVPVRPLHPRPGFEFPLRDGRLVFLSPILPEDRTRLVAAFEQLSERSRLFRFFRPIDRLSEAELQSLTQVDQLDHVAWCALDAPDPPFDGLGSARMIRDRDDPKTAEVAVTVLDAAQGIGLGTVLLGIVVLRARMMGIERLSAFVLPENRVVIGWLQALGWSVIAEDAVIEFAVRADFAAVPSPRSPSLGRFHRLLAELEGPLVRVLGGEGQTSPEPGESSPPGRGEPEDDNAPGFC